MPDPTIRPAPTAAPSDSATAGTGDMAATLPRWDLGDLYPGRDSQALAADLDAAARDAETFEGRYKGKLATLDGAGLAAAIAEYERLEEILGRVMSYAGLSYAADMSDPETGRFYQAMQERATDTSSHLLFFTLEINALEVADLGRRREASPALDAYGPWLEDVRAWRPHQLSDELERYIHDKSVVGRNAWTRLFDETVAGLRFAVEGRSLTSSEALNLLSDPSEARRKAAAEEIGRVFEANIHGFTLLTNTLAKEKQIEDRWRGFAQPPDSRHLSHKVERQTVEALVAAVKQAYPRLSHRYYALKARWFGGETLDYWNRNAPPPGDDGRRYDWREAQEIVLSAYRDFSREAGEMGQHFFERPWIDAEPRPGKAPGAFSHPTVPSAHPYLLVNYYGKVEDVMTLAHELGHGIHQRLAAEQGYLLSDTPLTLAETASVFGEMLTFKRLLAAESDPERRRFMLASKIEDMLGTVVRQIAMFDFELSVHLARREGELTADEIGAIWLEKSRESLGPALRFDSTYRHFWAYVPHFVHTPFYVYAYAFGDCLVNALYALYEDGHEGFVVKYLDLLRAGGTRDYAALLADFGLEAGDPGFWRKGLSVIEALIDELESLEG